ncbi:unnamed protein product [Lepeophtheirus salmonis]|uniref:(salmon louse) hypothetical protein n=1 Tax=Lepeophtheirus salmonis TaxID=72036 RepID=A0A7R8CKB7_LEPSM|nr:unnamed protein product [Lepeophtheirus salmonis]CAF2813822.1 unnamed protein product [Lepeophtheirus salmonis]
MRNSKSVTMKPLRIFIKFTKKRKKKLCKNYEGYLLSLLSPLSLLLLLLLLETSKEDELGEWKFKVKSLLNSLKSKEKQIIQLLKTNTDLKDSFDKESQELNKQLKIYQNEETEIFPWEAEPEEYRDLTPVDLLYIFKDEKLSHRVRAELYYKAVGHLKQDIELKMDRNIELVKELGEVKRQVDHLKLKYEELPKMESELNPSSNNILKINYHESVKSEGIMTRAAKRKSINIYSENRGPQPAYPSQERGENTEVNPFKIRSLLKPATLKVTVSHQ